MDVTDHLQVLDVVVGDGVCIREVCHWIEGLSNQVLPEEGQQIELKGNIGSDCHRQELMGTVQLINRVTGMMQLPL